MENFKFNIFDIFAAFLPGIPIIILLFFFNSNQDFSLNILTSHLETLNVYPALFYTIFCYTIGFLLQYPSYEIFKITSIKFWPKRMRIYPISIGKRGKEITLIRHFSPENFKILNTFFALRAMCYNCFFSLILFSIGIIVLMFQHISFEFHNLLSLLFSLLLSFLFLRRAVSFHEWIQNIITECKPLIKLEKNQH